MESVELIVGTYENVIVGFQAVPSSTKIDTFTLETSFTDDSHRGALRTVRVSSNGILASSSTDDSVRLHSLKRRKEIGSLFQHAGTVNSIRFFGKGHMFSASDDGTICLWKSKNWELLRTLKGHKAKVLSMCVHPSCKLGLSVGSDKGLLTWDLLTGKLAFQRKLNDVVECILFSTSGDHFILQFQNRVEVCNLEDTKTVATISLDWRINSISLLSDNLIVLGGENSCVTVVDMFSGKPMFSLDMMNGSKEEFQSRVKSVQGCEGQDDTALIFVGLASGVIKGFEIDLKDLTAKPVLKLTYETGVRLTCMSVFNHTEGEEAKSERSEGKKNPKASKVKEMPKDEIMEEESDIDSEGEAITEKSPQIKKKSSLNKLKGEKLKRKLKKTEKPELKVKAKKHKAV